MKVLGLAIALSFGLACAEGEPKCPVTPEEPIDPAISTEYQGSRVYFCCQRCRKKFLADPGRYAMNLAAARESPEAPRDHAHTHAEGGVRQLVNFAGKFHPATVHFPIALLVAAALAETLACRTGKSLFSEAARYCVWLAAPSALMAAGLGWAAGFFHSHPGLDLVFALHKWIGTGVAALAIGALFFLERWRRGNLGAKRFYWAFLFCGGTLVLISGALGGVLVYGWEHYQW